MKKLEEMTLNEKKLRAIICDLRNEIIGGFENLLSDNGEEEAEKAKSAAKAIFGGSGSSENMPSTVLSAEDLIDGKIGLLNLLVKTGLAPSVSEARRLVQQGGVSVNDVKASDPKAMIAVEGDLILRKGKKVYHKVSLK